jgi:hypothetical protein
VLVLTLLPHASVLALILMWNAVPQSAYAR